MKNQLRPTKAYFAQGPLAALVLTDALQLAKRNAQRVAVQVRQRTAPIASGVPGVFPHQSKYNPWRAYVWDKAAKKSIYLGAFPGVSKAKAAQTAYRNGAAVTSGTRAKLSPVKPAA